MHSKSGRLLGMEAPHVAGYLLDKGTVNAMVKVTSKGLMRTYRLDRWD